MSTAGNSAPSAPSKITSTPLSLLPHRTMDKSALTAAFVGKSLGELRTPALVVDRGVYLKNCVRVTERAVERGMQFRAHVKSALRFYGF